jgi:hypothetical protein
MKLKGKIKIGRVENAEKHYIIDMSVLKANTNKELIDFINKDISNYKKSENSLEPLKTYLTYNATTGRFGLKTGLY